MIDSLRAMLICLGVLGPSWGFSQVLLNERVWTALNGKSIKAELLAFAKPDDGKIKLRVREGNIYHIQPETLTREDQAVVLKARLEALFRSNYSEDSETYFFYSDHVPKSSEKESVVSYIGNNREKAWLRFKGSIDSELLSGGKEIIFDGISSGLVKLEFSEEDISERRRKHLLDLSLTNHAGKLADIFSDPKGLKVMIKKGAKEYSDVSLSRSEILGLRDTTLAFVSLQKLATDHVWWSTFKDLSPEETAKLKEDLNPVPEKETEMEEEYSSRVLLAAREWTRKGDDTSFKAEVVGFERHNVVFRKDDESILSIPMVDLISENRDVLATCRMSHVLTEKWHPYDDQFVWYWPTDLAADQERMDRQLILFAFDHENGDPKLFLQQHFPNESAIDIASCRLKSARVVLDIDLPADSGFKLRSPKSSRVWIPIDSDLAELLMVAAPAMVGIDFEITPEKGAIFQGTFTTEEYQASMEAIEIYRAWHSLLD